ncbi:hypothetical protein AMED_1389 [Amycolatopsis mediterranei U32]|uniref:Uncharacterized protein n=1 Tax=Amycolatopsis mediterranei (strain U-32) TaxID=749927 RepID=A0A0H3CXX9_AMYMU|nr:hypothetical protein AMED_1389 [Amycolatopsis mediterranei U32]
MPSDSRPASTCPSRLTTCAGKLCSATAARTPGTAAIRPASATGTDGCSPTCSVERASAPGGRTVCAPPTTTAAAA